jgi:hypothetical protein
MTSDKIRSHHLERKAILYVRQSSAYRRFSVIAMRKAAGNGATISPCGHFPRALSNQARANRRSARTSEPSACLK